MLVDLFHRVDELRVGVLARVSVEEPVDVRKQNEEVRLDRHGHDGRERIVVADAELLGGDGVVLVDDRQRAEL